MRGIHSPTYLEETSKPIQLIFFGSGPKKESSSFVAEESILRDYTKKSDTAIFEAARRSRTTS